MPYATVFLSPPNPFLGEVPEGRQALHGNLLKNLWPINPFQRPPPQCSAFDFVGTRQQWRPPRWRMRVRSLLDRGVVIKVQWTNWSTLGKSQKVWKAGQNMAMCSPLNNVLSLRCPFFKTTTTTDKGFYFPINIYNRNSIFPFVWPLRTKIAWKKAVLEKLTTYVFKD